MAFPEKQNQIRFDVEAVPLPRLRKTKANIKLYGLAGIEAFNNRQLMRCVATETKRHGDYVDVPKYIPPEIAREIPRHEWNCYRAKELNSAAAHQPLFDLLHSIVSSLCKQEEWVFYENKKNPQLECLASLVLHEFLHPSQFSKKSSTRKPDFSMSALAEAMHMDWRTYKKWHPRFVLLRPFIRKWYEDGKRRVKYN